MGTRLNKISPRPMKVPWLCTLTKRWAQWWSRYVVRKFAQTLRIQSVDKSLLFLVMMGQAATKMTLKR